MAETSTPCWIRRNWSKSCMPENNDSLEQALECKMGTARTIFLLCRYNIQIFRLKSKLDSSEELQQIMRDVTFFPVDTVRTIMCSVKVKNTFAKYLNTSRQRHSDLRLSYDWFRDMICRSYLENQTVPTKQKMLETNASDLCYSIQDLEEDMEKSGFILKKLDNTNKGLIVEKPAQIYPRLIYMNKVKNLRLLNRTFVYISCGNNNLCLAVSPKINMFSFKYCNRDEDGSALRLQFVKDLLPLLPESSAVLLESHDELKSNLTPTQYSTKHEMQKWLERNEILCEKQAHTAELYALIQKFKYKHPESCMITELLDSYGFDVLRVPNKVSGLSYFCAIFEQTNGLACKSDAESVRSVFEKFGSKELCALEEILIKKEIEEYSKDLQLEKVVDTISVAATQMAFKPHDLNSCGDYDSTIVPPYIILD